MQLCSQMLAPPQSFHWLLMRLCWQILAPAVLAFTPAAVMLADSGAPAVLAGAPLAVVLALLAPPLLSALPLPLSYPCPPPRSPPDPSIVGLLRVAVIIAAEGGRAADGGAGEGAVEQRGAQRPGAGDAVAGIMMEARMTVDQLP